MLTHPTRRWLAGLGVAGALVAASAAPGHAAAPAADLNIYLPDTTVAVKSDGKVISPLLSAAKPVVLDGATVRYDYRGLAGKATVKADGEGCSSPAEGVLVCAEASPVGLDDWGLQGLFKVSIAPTGAAQDGDTGEIKVTLTADGHSPATHTAQVRVGGAANLSAGGPQPVEASLAPGEKTSTQMTLINITAGRLDGVVAVFDHDRAIQPGEKHRNCTYDGDQIRTCSWGRDTFPRGNIWAAFMPWQVRKDAYAPGSAHASYTWFTTAEFEDYKAYLDHIGVSTGTPGKGYELGLLPTQTNPDPNSLQADPDPSDNTGTVDITITGKNGADLAAVGGSVTGKANAVVKAIVGVKNNGPASLDFGRSGNPITRVDVTVPAGATAVDVPDTCAPFDGRTADQQDAGKPGAKAYRCETGTYLATGTRQTFTFGLRVDQVVPNSTGAVTINATCECDGFTKDTNPANDTAKLVLNPAGAGGGTGPSGGEGDGQGGGDGDGGTLPITGSPTTLIAGAGGLLLVAGAAGYLVARRRRTNFVA
ncbi:LPXTG cell wall anchor domain-containing protein [Micromonospora sp. NPDC000089]|uniref:LPXTG cell wall anchor domain-containing protein n=1 Tax=unclassified Micromonospora TaxID=2617518 RepID=UPI0036870059